MSFNLKKLIELYEEGNKSKARKYFDIKKNIKEKEKVVVYHFIQNTYKNFTTEFNRNNKYIVDAIIIDEMSMVDSSIFHHVVTSISENTILILVGDSAQLPSVGSGDVLRSLLKSKRVKCFNLTHIYRQDHLSDIIKVSHSILTSKSFNTNFNKDSEIVFLNYHDDDVISEICKLSLALKNKGSNFQVISPVYDGELGVDNLNRSLRHVLNSEFSEHESPKLKIGDTDIYEGDRVMVIKNDYERMIYNGDVGKIQKISFKSDEIDVKVFEWFDPGAKSNKYPDKLFVFKVEEAKQMLRVAYATTVHKCQGQEFDYIIMPMTKKFGIMLYKNLIYTAITRAKKKVFIFGDVSSFVYAANNNRDISRNSLLNEFIDD